MRRICIASASSVVEFNGQACLPALGSSHHATTRWWVAMAVFYNMAVSGCIETKHTHLRTLSVCAS